MNSVNITNIPNDRADVVAGIYNEHGDWIREVINRGVWNGNDNEDIFQEFFIMLLTKPKLPEAIHKRGFLFRVLKNDIIDFMRRKKNYANRLERLPTKKPAPTLEVSAFEQLLQNKSVDFILKLINEELSGSLCETMHLHIKYKGKNPKVAQHMQLGEPSTRRYLYLGRKKIKQLLIENGYTFVAAG